MKKIMASIVLVTAISSAVSLAVAQDSPVSILPENSTATTTTIVTDPESGTTNVTIEEQPAVYDAITGELVDPEEALKEKQAEPESLRDEVRGKMTE